MESEPDDLPLALDAAELFEEGFFVMGSPHPLSAAGSKFKSSAKSNLEVTGFLQTLQFISGQKKEINLRFGE